MSREPTRQEIAEINEIRESTSEAVRALKAIAESERRRPASEKFVGPVGLPLELNPDPCPDPDTDGAADADARQTLSSSRFIVVTEVP